MARSKLNKYSVAILFLGVFFLTLVSFPIYAWILGLIFVSLFMINEKVSLKKRAIGESLFFLIFLILAVIRFQVFLIEDVLSLFRNAFWGNFSKYMICILAWLVLRSIVFDKRKQSYLKKILGPLLLVHVVVFYLQFFIYLITGNYIDFFELFTSNTSSYFAFNDSLQGIGSVRPTGLYEEPSTYTGAILIMSSLLFLSGGFEKHKKLFFFAILSMYLSFSTAAMIYGTLFTIFILYSTKTRSFLRLRHYFFLGIIALGIIFFAGPKLVNLYQAQIIKFGNTSDLRFNLSELAAKRPLDKVFMANGAFALEEDIAIASNPNLSRQGRETGSISASGLFVFMWIQFGYLGILYFLILAWWQYRQGRKNLILFLIISLCKIQLFAPLFVVYFGLCSFKGFRDFSFPKKLKQPKLI